MYYPRIDETVTFRRLKNGLPAYVVHKPGYTRKYAMFATRYGGMDLRFQQDGAWQDTPRASPTIWSTRCLTPLTGAMPCKPSLPPALPPMPSPVLPSPVPL